jgi:anti-sigma-K factor RskA
VEYTGEQRGREEAVHKNEKIYLWVTWKKRMVSLNSSLKTAAVTFGIYSVSVLTALSIHDAIHTSLKNGKFQKWRWIIAVVFVIAALTCITLAYYFDDTVTL